MIFGLGACLLAVGVGRTRKKPWSFSRRVLDTRRKNKVPTESSRMRWDDRWSYGDKENVKYLEIRLCVIFLDFKNIYYSCILDNHSFSLPAAI